MSEDKSKKKKSERIFAILFGLIVVMLAIAVFFDAIGPHINMESSGKHVAHNIEFDGKPVGN